MDTTWTINAGTVAAPVWGEHITRMGTDNHLLKLDVTLTDEHIAAMENATGISLNIHYTEGTSVGSRRIYAWTDLSAPADEINDITFATQANVSENRSVMASPAAMHTALTIPRNLLVAADGRRATAFYVVLTINNNDDAITSSGNRGGGPDNQFEFRRWEKVDFSISAITVCSCGTCEECTRTFAEDLVVEWDFTKTIDLMGGRPGSTTVRATGGNNRSGATFNKSDTTHFHATAIPNMVRADNGFVSTYGWLHNPDNYYYLEFNTKGHEHLQISYDIQRSTSSSAPSRIMLQTSVLHQCHTVCNDGCDPNCEDRCEPDCEKVGTWSTWRSVKDSFSSLVPFEAPHTWAPTAPETCPIVPMEVYLPLSLNNTERVRVRFFYSNLDGTPSPPGTSANNNLGGANGTSGFINLRNIKVESGHVDPNPDCECGRCSRCIHIFEFPLNVPTTQHWDPGFQEGWEDPQFPSPTGDAVSAAEKGGERTAADIRYLVMDFNTEPAKWRFTIQNTTWRRYDIDFPAGLTETLEVDVPVRDAEGNPVVDANGNPVTETKSFPAEGRERVVLEDGTVRYIIDMETAMPAVNKMGNWTAERDEHFLPHPGYSRNVAWGTFQILFHSNPPVEPWLPADEFLRFDGFVDSLNRAFFTNVHPRLHRIIPEEPVPGASRASLMNSQIFTANTTDWKELKLYFDYTAPEGLDGVRLQYRIGTGAWNNLQSAISVFDTAAEPTREGVSVLLPRETYDQANLQFRFVRHGSTANWEQWGAHMFRAANLRIMSGLQAGERARAPSPVLTVGSVANPPTSITQRTSSDPINPPSITLREEIPETPTTTGIQWISRDTNVVRTLNVNPADISDTVDIRATILRAMNPTLPGQRAVIRAASSIDTSIFTEFEIDITPGTTIPNIMYTIHNPYKDVNWDTWKAYKAAHHTHTTFSDGAASVAEVAERKYLLGFDFVAITDHNRISRTPDQMSGGRGSSNGFGPIVPMSSHRINEMHNGVGRDGRGMMFIPNSNEQSSMVVPGIAHASTGHHVNTYWWDDDTISGEQVSSLVSRLSTQQFGSGIGRMNHLGRNTGGLFPARLEDAIAISHNSSNFMPYVNILRSPYITGMEIINKFDTETQADRVLWDNILSQLMPEGVPVYGYSDDDSHFQIAQGFSYNFMMMPEQSLAELRHSMESGAFFAFSRVDRQYGIYPGGITANNWEGNDTRDVVQNVKFYPEPKVRRISVDQDNATITIDAEIETSRTNNNMVQIDNTATHYINWYADGVKIHTGKTLDLKAHQLNIYSYVRASIATPHGVLYTQPFGVEIRGQERAKAVLTNVDSNLTPGMAGSSERAPIEVPSGSPLTEMGLRLPGGTHIATSQGPRPATIIWDLNNLPYDPNRTGEDQTFTVRGKVRLLEGVNGVRHLERCERADCVARGACVVECSNPACIADGWCTLECDFEECEFRIVSLDVSVEVTVKAHRCKSCDPRTKETGAAEAYMWRPNYDNKTVTGTNVGGDLGIINAASGQLNIDFVGNNIMQLRGDGGGNRAIRIVTDEGHPSAEGSGWNEALSADLQAGVRYRLSFTASISAGEHNSRIVHRGGFSGDTTMDAVTYNLTQIPQKIVYEWVHFGTNVVAIDTGNQAPGVVYTITDLVIHELVPCPQVTDCVQPCSNGLCGNCAVCKAPKTACPLHPNQAIPCMHCVAIGLSITCAIHPDKVYPCETCIRVPCEVHPNVDTRLAPCGICAGTHCPTHPNVALIDGVCRTCTPPPQRCSVHTDEPLPCRLCAPPRKIGDIRGTGSVGINDALEILKFLAKLPSALTVNSAQSTALQSMAMARITVGATQTPTINCALEILKYLAKLDSLLNPHWR
jgi:hypothetical protein